MKHIVTFLFCVMQVINIQIMAQTQFPNREEKILALSTIWKELHYNYAFPEKLYKANIDSLYLAYLPKIDQANNFYDYYHILSSFMAHFNDAHTRIIADIRPDDHPAITVQNIGTNIIVNNIAKKWIDKIPLGSQILEVNNIPVSEYIKDSVYQYISASTKHWKFDKSITELFYGKPQTSLKLTIKTPTGKEEHIKMIRDYNRRNKKEIMVKPNSSPPINIQNITENIGYIQLNSFSGAYVDEINSVFNNHLAQLIKCKGLIIDIRGNRGGTDEAWETIINHLMPNDEYTDKGKWLCRKNVTTYMVYGEFDEQLKDYYMGTSMQEIIHPPLIVNLNDSLKLNQPLIILSGQYVGSAAEDLLLFMKENGRATVIGEPSVGCVGEPMFVNLPGNYQAMICTKKYVNQDGTQPNDSGVLPDIIVKRSYESYINGKDNQLEKAIELLNEQLQAKINQ